MVIEFDLRPAELLFVSYERAAASKVVKIAYRAGFALGPLLGVFLAFYSPVVCCLLPSHHVDVRVNGARDAPMEQWINGAAWSLSIAVYGVIGTLIWWMAWRRFAPRFGQNWINSWAKPILDCPGYWGRRSVSIDESGLRIKMPSEERLIQW